MADIEVTKQMPPHPGSTAVILAIAEGRIPDGIDPDSARGRHYARLASGITADMLVAPQMSDEMKTRVVALLRGGRDASV